MINVLYAAAPTEFSAYEPHLLAAFDAHKLQVNLSRDLPPQDVDYIVYAPSSPLQDFTPYTNCKAILNTWAGVEQITGNATITQPLCRMVDTGMSAGMCEYVLGHVMRHHLNLDACIINPTRRWEIPAAPLAQSRSVAVLGLGALGSAVARQLAKLGFQVSGWSRREKQIEGITCHHGDAGLEAILKQAEICVTLLPSTAQTENILNAQRLAMMPKGAIIINPGRGPLIDDAALLDALDRGHIAHATLDVFRTEPVPDDHPYWAHPNVTITPHIAATTRPETASTVIAENIARGETGKPFLHLVDRAAGY